MFILTTMCGDLNWWKEDLPSGKSPIRQFSFQKEIFSDASTSGWGALYKCESAHGFWNAEEQKLHINFLELLAACSAIKTFASQSHDCEVVLHIESTTVIAYMNKMGAIQYSNLNSLNRKIWKWCESREIWVYASYIASMDNIEVDRESRIKKVDTEWELSVYAFKRILENFPSLEIDLLATNLNSKCNLFCLWTMILMP